MKTTGLMPFRRSASMTMYDSHRWLERRILQEVDRNVKIRTSSEVGTCCIVCESHYWNETNSEVGSFPSADSHEQDSVWTTILDLCPISGFSLQIEGCRSKREPALHTCGKIEINHRHFSREIFLITSRTHHNSACCFGRLISSTCPYSAHCCCTTYSLRKVLRLKSFDLLISK